MGTGSKHPISFGIVSATKHDSEVGRSSSGRQHSFDEEPTGDVLVRAVVSFKKQAYQTPLRLRTNQDSFRRSAETGEMNPRGRGPRQRKPSTGH